MCVKSCAQEKTSRFPHAGCGEKTESERNKSSLGVQSEREESSDVSRVVRKRRQVELSTGDVEKKSNPKEICPDRELIMREKRVLACEELCAEEVKSNSPLSKW